MTTQGSTARDDLRCAVMTNALGEQPAGSAGSWHRVILVELPLPWPDSIDDHPLLAGVPTTSPDGRTHRILALASALSPAQATPDDGFRVICYWRPVGQAFQQFDRAEICAPEDGVAEIVEHLVTADDATLAAIPADSFAAGSAAVQHAVRDLLICTHGTRDRCCGRFGTDLFRALEDEIPEGVRLWRTSHTGGHRFAPTGLTFPDGGTWAGLDVELVLGLIDRTIGPDEAAGRARGSAGIDGAPAQVADIAGLATQGWPWLDQPRSMVTTADDDGHRVDVTVGGAADSSFGAVVQEGRTIPVPDCGNPLDMAKKSTVEWVLESFDRR